MDDFAERGRAFHPQQFPGLDEHGQHVVDVVKKRPGKRRLLFLDGDILEKEQDIYLGVNADRVGPNLEKQLDLLIPLLSRQGALPLNGDFLLQTGDNGYRRANIQPQFISPAQARRNTFPHRP